MKKWFGLVKNSANQSFSDAQYLLSTYYMEGSEGIDADSASAIYYLRLAPDQGNTNAQAQLGFEYWSGRFVAQDYYAAAHLYQLAADKGLAEAQFNLGVVYNNGQGVPKVPDKISQILSQGCGPRLWTRSLYTW